MKKRILSFFLCILFIVSVSLLNTGASASDDINEMENVQQSTIEFEDGGKDIIYVIDGVKNHFFVPPDDFNPIKATDAQLERYGFPMRPQERDSVAYNEWLSLMSSYRETPEPNIAVTRSIQNETPCDSASLQSLVASTVIEKTSNNWSGYVSYLGSNSSQYYTQAQVDYIEPTITKVVTPGAYPERTTKLNAYWIGFGGTNGSKKLVQAGTVISVIGKHQYHHAWYEYLSDTGQTVSIQYLDLAVNPGDNIHVYISFQKANGVFGYYIANNTTGEYVSGLVENLNSAQQFDGSMVEWIVERCEVTPDKGEPYISTLGDYGSIVMKNCKATLNNSNTWIDLADLSGLQLYQMKSSETKKILSQPDPITDKNQFTCSFVDYY